MPAKIILCWLLLLGLSGDFVLAGSDTLIPSSKTVASDDITAWGIGLLIVLSLFFLCAVGVRKFSGLTVSGAEKMRVVDGLSLGLREKIILLQVGRKQLILGVTPGHIETLHVLEGDDCLVKAEARFSTTAPDFLQKLMLATKADSDA